MAFFVASVSVAGAGGLRAPVTIGLNAGLVLGKAIRVLGATWLVSGLPARLSVTSWVGGTCWACRWPAWF
ncbi:hypothetical protein [Polymorphospora sp. NPDC050346]|uniref:hypothetical protein n=1 Tax=Polymorphospora sp. NPDC050346 TaxID=3155780 RepID=UPI0033C7E907